MLTFLVVCQLLTFLTVVFNLMYLYIISKSLETFIAVIRDSISQLDIVKLFKGSLNKEGDES